MRAAAGHRIDGMDAARGTAMLFVCLSHFGLEYFRLMGDPPVRVFAYTVGMVASPTFMLLSGITLGMLYEMRPAGFGRLRLTLLNRGLFMLTIGHALIVLSTLPREGSFSASVRLGFITDVVGVAVLLGPALVRRVGPAVRTVVAAGLYVLGVILTLGWQPEARALELLRFILVGSFPEVGAHNFPLLPWLAVYVVGTVIGQFVARAEMARSGDAQRTLFGIGGISLLVVAYAKVVDWFGVPPGTGIVTFDTVTYDFFSPWQKLPAAPLYLACFGGLGLVLIASVLRLAASGRARWLMENAAILGRASLFVFILQFYVYYVGFHLLRLPYSPMWPLYFVASLALIWLAARWWDARGYQRFLTVGVRTLRSPTRASVLDLARAIRSWTKRVASNLALE